MGGGPSVDRDSGFRLRPDERSALLSGEIQPDGPFFRREVASTDQAEGWSLYLRLASGEARVLHDARTMIGAARALVAADWGYGFPVTLEAWDMCCEAESLCALPEALRRAFRLRDARRGVCAGGVD